MKKIKIKIEINNLDFLVHDKIAVEGLFLISLFSNKRTIKMTFLSFPIGDFLIFLRTQTQELPH